MSNRTLFVCLLFLAPTANTPLFALQLAGGLSSTESRLNQIPLVFEPNRGQADRDVRYLSRGNAYTVLLAADKTTLVIPSKVGSGNHAEKASIVTLELLQSNKVSPEGVDLLPGKSNYFIGKQSTRWIAGIPQYGRVAFKSIYSGIDLVYYGSNGQLEYDFLVSPGADPRTLRFRVKGARTIALNGTGNLYLETADGAIELQKPTIYQEVAGIRQSIAGDFALSGDNEIGFRVGNYDDTKPLIIDPVLSYSTLIGANNNTTVQGIAVDASGDVYITGTTFATNYPTVNAFQASNHGISNIFITKLNPAGNGILYSTYLGGSDFDNAAAIAVDGTGNAYVTGTATSSDFPTTPGAFMTSCPSFCNTPFVSKFLSDGSLAFSTYMGGSNSPAHAIAVNIAGEAYIAGDSASNDLPTTPGSFEPVYPGLLCTTCFNGYVEKLNASGTALVYSTYFGLADIFGAPSTAGRGIAVDSAGSAYLVGSTNAIPLQNPIQSGNIGNAFITKFSADGSSLIYSTYFGGGGDIATGVALDSSNNVHITGTTISCSFPLSLNALSTECATATFSQMVFVATLNSSGGKVLFSTFLPAGVSSGIAVDQAGNTYVAGTTTSNSFPMVNPIEGTSQRSSSSSFVTGLDPAGRPLFSTYLGATGSGSEASGIAVDDNGNIYVAGTAQGDFPLLHPIPSQILQNGFYSLFVSKMSRHNLPQFSLSPRVSPVLSLRNVSSVPLTINAITSSPNFTRGGNCGTNLAPGTGCTLILEGVPDNKTSGTVTVTSNASSEPQTFSISKSPSGDGVGSIVTVFPTFLRFPAQLLGTTSGSQQIVIENSGLAPAAINSILMIQPAAFTETNDCPALLNPSSFCTISVTYTPTAGQDAAQLAIVTDPNQTGYTAFLSGTGSSSAIAASVASVRFGTQLVGSPSLGLMVNFTNTTPYPASVTGVSASPGFSQTNTCRAVLTPQASCRASVSYVPATNENATGTLTAASLGPGGSQSVSLNGTGLISSDLSAAPMPAEVFAYLGEAAGSVFVSLTNTSQLSMNLASFAVTGPFTQKNNCHGHLSAGASCTLTVNFTPTDVGTFNGSVSIQHSGKGSPQIVPIIGTGSTVFTVTPTLLDLGQQQVGVPVIGFLDLGNNANFGDVTVTSITVQGADFSLAKDGCQSVFHPFTGCGDLEIAFTPTATGLRTGTVTVVASDTSLPHVATVQGTGVSSGQGTLSVASLDFGVQAVGTASQPQSVILTNNGTGVLTLGAMSASSQFAQTNTCSASLAAGASCMVSVRFAPTLQGMLVGSLSVADDGTGSPHTVKLSGIGL